MVEAYCVIISLSFLGINCDHLLLSGDENADDEIERYKTYCGNKGEKECKKHFIVLYMLVTN